MFCKSASQKAGGHHQHTLADGIFFEKSIALHELPRTILKPASLKTGCHYLFEIELLTGFGEAKVYAVCMKGKEVKKDR